MAAALVTVRVQTGDFDIGEEVAKLAQGDSGVGAVVSFSGLCRDEGGRLSALEIEHYPGMAESEITTIAEQAASRWPLSGVSAIHRFGMIRPGENIVLVVTASAHRDAAFAAASFLMDYLKSRAPFWKREHMADGSQGEWVAAKESDEEAARRWR